MQSKDNVLAALFKEYGDSSLLERLELYALWTISSVFPSAENRRDKGNAVIEHDYQSVGALLVNRLASKLARTLFPVGTSFFKIEITEQTKAQIAEVFKQDMKSNDTSLINLENAACRRLFLKASYAQLVQALRLLIVTGECLLHRASGRVSVYSLRNYVVQRNNVGEVQRIILKEPKKYFELEQKYKTLVGERDEDATLDLYTQVLRVAKNVGGKTLISWEVTQEIDGFSIDGKVVYRENLCPYIPVTWSFMNGDAYGRGYVEEYAGDFAKLSELSAALTNYELQSTRVLNVFNPAGQFDIDSAVDAESGAWVQGQKESIQSFEVGDYRKIQELRLDIQSVEQRLSTAFMYTGNTRDAERVTALEVQMNAEEAEQVLGGVYSQLSQNMHLPLAYILLNEVDPSIISAFDLNNIELNILTGLVALSRSSENQALMIAANQIAQAVPVFSQISKKYDIDKLVDGILLSNGIDPASIQKSLEQLQQEAAQEEQAAMAQQQAIMQQGNQLQNTEAVLAAQGQPI